MFLDQVYACNVYFGFVPHDIIPEETFKVYNLFQWLLQLS